MGASCANCNTYVGCGCHLIGGLCHACEELRKQGKLKPKENVNHPNNNNQQPH